MPLLSKSVLGVEEGSISKVTIGIYAHLHYKIKSVKQNFVDHRKLGYFLSKQRGSI